MMQFVSEKLLEAEVKKLEEKENLDSHEKLWLTMCKKELLVISKLKIEGIDMTGYTDEVQKRLDGQSIYLMKKEEFDQIKEKAEKFDAVKNYCK